MTFYDGNSNGEGGEVMPELKVRVEGDDNGVNGKRVTLRQRLLEECEAEERYLLVKEPAFSCIQRRSIWFWVKLGVLFTFIGLLAAVFFRWVGPFLMDKVCSPPPPPIFLYMQFILMCFHIDFEFLLNHVYC